MEQETDRYYYERTAAEHGFTVVCGIDEAGRGPLAGPVFAAAVILPQSVVIDGLDDSKKLSEKKRDMLFEEIKARAVYAVASASESEIDEINILNATFLAMRRAFDALPQRPQAAFVDGNRLPKLPVPAKAIVKGDSLSASIAAASIMAKVSRDRYMLELDKKYPEYCFAKHKGYGTKLHYEKIREYGISEVHRRTFLKKLPEDW
ncbi:MAG: ribonuclease HII [Clostridia bacterium]|nr:ribonuclease HII [Clostridia bacterium]